MKEEIESKDWTNLKSNLRNTAKDAATSTGDIGEFQITASFESSCRSGRSVSDVMMETNHELKCIIVTYNITTEVPRVT